jgi:WD40 repeat protein
MPNLILTPPDSTLQESAPLSPSAGWVDPEKIGRPGIDRRSSHNKTPTPRNILGTIDGTTVDSTNSSDRFESTEGDGEDLDDLWGRPRSPEQIAKARPNRETIALGSRGANSRSNVSKKPLSVSTAEQDTPEEDQQYWSATSPKSPPFESSAKLQSITNSAIEMGATSRAAVETAAPQPRRAMNFFSRKRDNAAGVGRDAPVVNKLEGSKRDSPASNAAFWRLSRKQSNRSSSFNIDAEDRAEGSLRNSGATKEQLDVANKVNVRRPSMRSSYDSERPGETEIPSKPSQRAISSEVVARGGCHRKVGTTTLLSPSMQPRRVKVRRLKRTTKDRDFAHVYLAQELRLSTEASSATDTELKPVLSHLDSSNSLASSSTSCSKTSSASSPAKKTATWAMKFSLDGKHLAVAGQDAVIRVYAVLDTEAARRKIESDAAAAAELLKLLSGYNGSTCSLNSLGRASRKSFSDKSDKEGSAKSSSSLPNLAVFNPVPIREFKGHTNDILDLNWSKGGFLLSCGMDKTAKVWHLSHPNSLVSFVHGDFVTCAVFHPRDDRYFLSGSLDGKLRLWNITIKKVQHFAEVPGLITACSFTESGDTACAGTFAGHALFYNTENLRYTGSVAIRSPSGKHAHGGKKVTSIQPLLSLPATSSNPTKSQGERVMITTNDSRIRCYELKDKSMIARFKANSYINRTSQIKASASDDNVFIVAGSEATHNDGGMIFIWNTSNHLSDTVRKTSAKSMPSTLSTDFNVEYFSAHSATVTCAVMAPLSTHGHLLTSNDYLLKESERRLTYNAKTMSPSASFSGALSKLAPGKAESDTRRFNRIIVSVDENAVLRVWRSDSLQTVEG